MSAVINGQGNFPLSKEESGAKHHVKNRITKNNAKKPTKKRRFFINCYKML